MKNTFFLCFIILIASESSFSQWNASPSINTPVCLASGNQFEVRVISDGKDGAIAAWLDYRNNIPFDSTNADIFVQRIDKNGYAKWTVNGIGVCTDALDQPAVNIVSDGASGAIIIWRDQRNANNDIYAQKVDSSGNIAWAAGGVPVCSGTTIDQKGAKAVSDGNGGAIVSWEDNEQNVATGWDIYAQRISSSGTVLWNTLNPTRGISICKSLEDQINPRIETDGSGGAIIVWQDSVFNTWDIFAQRVNSSGSIMWTLNGIQVLVNSSRHQYEPKIEPDGAGGAIIGWLDSNLVGGDINIYSQRIDALGAKQWTSTGVPVCVDTSKQTAFDIASEGINGAVFAWKDSRSASKDIYIQKIELSGTVQWTLNGIPATLSPADEGNPNLYGDGFGNVICVFQDSVSPIGSTSGNVIAQKIDASGNWFWGGLGAAVGTASNQQTQPKHVPDGAGGAIFFFIDNRSNPLDYDIYAHHLYWNGTADGINDINNQNPTVLVYPNPFKEYTRITIIGQNVEEPEIRIFDLLGNTIKCSASAIENGFLIQKNDNMQNGIYFFKITGKNNFIANRHFIITE